MSLSLDSDPPRNDVTEASLENNDPSKTDHKGYRFPADEVGIPLTKLQWWLTFLGLCLSLFLAAVDTTIVATAIPKIGSDFNALEQASWIATAYILSFDALQPMYGKLSDIFGRKNTLLVAVFIFLLGSVLCGVSTNMIMIIVMRALQGAGGAGIFGIVFITTADMIPLYARGQYSALISTVFAIASVCGPLIDQRIDLGCFYGSCQLEMGLPIGGVGCILLVLFLKEHREPTSIRKQMTRIDYLGTIALLAFATLILVALNLGGVKYSWSSAPVLACLIVGFFFIPILALIEWKFAKEPMIPLHLFKKRTVTCICLLNVFFGGAWLSVIIELPLFLQAARGDSATMSGVRIIVGQAAITVTSSIGGYMMGRLNSYKPIINTGAALTSLGIGLLALFTDTAPFGEMYGFFLIAGAGAGMVYACGTVAAQSACEKHELAVVTVLVNFFMNLGSAVGIAVASAVVNNGLEDCLGNQLSPDLFSSVLQSTTFIRSGALSPEQENITIKCYVSSFKTAWTIMACFAAVGFIASLFIEQHSLFRDSKRSPKSEESEVSVDETAVDVEK